MPVTQGPVVYFAAERTGLMRRRFKGLEKCYDLPSDLPLYLGSGAFDIREAKDAGCFIDGIREIEDELGEPVRFVVFDTWSRILAGGIENDSADVGNAVKNIDQIREAINCHVMAVHHVGAAAESKQRMRGSTVLFGAIDTGTLVEKNKNVVKVMVRKQNDGPDDLQLAADLASFVTGKDEHGNDVTVPYLVASTEPPPVAMKLMMKVPKAVLAALRDAMLTDGETPPAGSPGIPADTRSVSTAAWRTAYYDNAPSLTHDARRMNFQRGVKALIEAGHVGSVGDRYWPA